MLPNHPNYFPDSFFQMRIGEEKFHLPQGVALEQDHLPALLQLVFQDPFYIRKAEGHFRQNIFIGKDKRHYVIPLICPLSLIVLEPYAEINRADSRA